MIDDAALLQADVTVIVGILVFLTLAPIKQEQGFRQSMQQSFHINHYHNRNSCIVCDICVVMVFLSC
jgi:formate hydrogenlyase subunit 6/NADH:ubiquinone oxidoreductase subunit I